jgi:hypothetical protein
MLLHSEYIVTLFKKFKWRNIMYTVRFNKTKSDHKNKSSIFHLKLKTSY